MVADSDRRGNRASSTSTTTTCSETSYNSTTATIPLRVMTPEDANTPAVLSPVNEKVLEALLAEAPTLREFISSHKEVEGYKTGSYLPLTGNNLSLPAVVAAALYPSLVSSSVASTVADLKEDKAKLEALLKSRKIIDDKLAQNKSIYGVSTGFGGSADTRTAEHDHLGSALLQHQHAGILPSSLEARADANARAFASNNAKFSKSSSPAKSSKVSPLPITSESPNMPAPWVRAALLIRLNSLLRGHSAASPELLFAMGGLLEKGVTPVVPMRGSISASGDLSPLSYIAGTLIGERGIFCMVPKELIKTSPAVAGSVDLDLFEEDYVPLRAPQALRLSGLNPVSLRPKEHLAILNGTAFSCGLASLVVDQAREMILLGTALTALGTEAMRGSRESFNEFVMKVRPHPGQVEAGAMLLHLLEGSKLATSHEPAKKVQSDENDEKLAIDDGEEETIDADAGTLRQDRYPLRTAPQWLGPQLEIVQAAAKTITIECNSTTDNPLIDPDTGIVHHGGNFQAMSVTAALEPLRLALFHTGKLLFAQTTELLNPLMNRGLAGNLAASNFPSLNFAAKGLDIGMAAYTAELGALSGPVSSYVQSAEMHNQAVNSMALVSARWCARSLEVLGMIIASCIWCVCQAVDLRALQNRAEEGVEKLVLGLLEQHFFKGEGAVTSIDADEVFRTVWTTFDSSASMDLGPRAEKAAKASTQPIIDALMKSSSTSALIKLPAFQEALSKAIYDLYDNLTTSFLSSTLSPSAGEYYLPASPLLGRTRALYEFVRKELKVGMHGLENHKKFEGGLSKGVFEDDRVMKGEKENGSEGRTIGGDVSVIYEAIREGKMRDILVGMFEGF